MYLILCDVVFIVCVSTEAPLYAQLQVMTMNGFMHCVCRRPV